MRASFTLLKRWDVTLRIARIDQKVDVDIHVNDTKPVPLQARPAIGTRVVTSSRVDYDHEPSRGTLVTVATTVPFATVGTVVGHSRLDEAEFGTLVDVDWGNGVSVRFNINELYDESWAREGEGP